MREADLARCDAFIKLVGFPSRRTAAALPVPRTCGRTLARAVALVAPLFSSASLTGDDRFPPLSEALNSFVWIWREAQAGTQSHTARRPAAQRARRGDEYTIHVHAHYFGTSLDPLFH